MSERDDGGPAFASVTKVSKVVDPSSYNLGDGPEHLKYNEIIETTSGITLRDYFAVRAPKYVYDLEGWSQAELAKEAGVKEYRWREHYKQLVSKLQYEYADAMLAERAKGRVTG